MDSRAPSIHRTTACPRHERRKGKMETAVILAILALIYAIIARCLDGNRR
jgi:hypothetical protein